MSIAVDIVVNTGLLFLKAAPSAALKHHPQHRLMAIVASNVRGIGALSALIIGF